MTTFRSQRKLWWAKAGRVGRKVKTHATRDFCKKSCPCEGHSTFVSNTECTCLRVWVVKRFDFLFKN